VSEQVRSAPVTALVSPVSALPVVRRALVELQRAIGAGAARVAKGVVVEGTRRRLAHLPAAPWRFYLDASLRERARGGDAGAEKRARRRRQAIHASSPRRWRASRSAIASIASGPSRRSACRTGDGARHHAPRARAGGRRDLRRDAAATRAGGAAAREAARGVVLNQAFKGPLWLCLQELLPACASSTPSAARASGGLRVVANHQSFFDPPLLGVALPRVLDYTPRATLKKSWFYRLATSGLDLEHVEREGRDVGAARRMIERLKRGEAIALFPEQTRTADGCLQRITPGFHMLAAHAGVPVLPVLIEGAHEVWPRGQARPRFSAGSRSGSARRWT
jgi:1-acyl-sn-glycerol-3-phosphate acyltransferase